MKHILLALGASALFASAPALAGHGHGRGEGHDRGERHGHGHGYKHSYGGNSARHESERHGKVRYYSYGRSCPPGLYRRDNGCMPRGHFRRLYRHGQRYNSTYGNRWSYNQIPYDLRNQYGLSPNYRYYYGDGYIYQVDPRTMLIQQVLNAILR